jgi:hypothetical protein
MKQLLVFLFIFHAGFAISAQKAEDGHDCEGKGLPPDEEGVNGIEKIQSQLILGKEDKFKSLVEKICSRLMHERQVPNSDIGLQIEGLILDYNSWSRQTPNYRQNLETFWSANKNNFICPGNSHYKEQHLFKMIVKMQMYVPVLNKYFLSKKPGYSIDMNAYEIKDNKVITIVDYLQGILDSPKGSTEFDTRQIRRLLAIIKRKFNAKSGAELSIEKPQILKGVHKS